VQNTAVGSEALAGNLSGNGNTAEGYEALAFNTFGNYNTAVGYTALAANTTGGYTTAVGAFTLSVNTTGGYDTAFGAYSLPNNTTGTGNTAFGYASLRSTTTGNENIGFGYQALYLDATGSGNIAMGYQAASKVASGSNNIEIGNVGVSSDNNVIRIGTESTQTTAYLAGVSGTQITGAAVYVTSSGQLGVQASSERYKTKISSLGSITDRLQELRPVSFHLKTDPNGAVQYGLIAEEVDKVYPELVIRDATGKIQGVHYEELAPMLLNELQQQEVQLGSLAQDNERQVAIINAQGERINSLIAQSAEQNALLRQMDEQLADLKELRQQLRAALTRLNSNDAIVARR